MAVRDFPKYESNKDNYIYVDNVSNFVNKILKVDNLPDSIAVDTETYYNPDLKAPQAICKWINGAKNNCPFGASFFTGTQGYWVDHNLYDLDKLLRSPIDKDLHHMHYDENMFRNIGLTLGGYIWDTLIMINLIDEEFMCKMPPDDVQWQEVKYKKSKRLKDLSYHFGILGGDAHLYEDLVKEYRKIIAANQGRSLESVSYKEVSDANPILMKDYAIADTEDTYHLKKILLPMLKEQNLLTTTDMCKYTPYDIDLNATFAVIDIEREGFLVDKEAMKKDEEKLEEIIKNNSVAVDNLLGVHSGTDFNINSDKELVEQFEKLGVKWEWWTEKDELKTDKTIMKLLMKNDNSKIVKLAELVLIHRKAEKILSTYITGVKDYIQEDGRVHPDFNITSNERDEGGTITGRLSASNPNMQNMTKKPVKFEEDEM